MNTTKNNMEAAMTDAEMEAQFIERNSNLKNTISHIADKIDTAANKTQDFLNTNVQNAAASSDYGNSGLHMGGSSNPSAAAGTTLLGQRTGLETNMDKKLMNNITSDIKAMHSTDPETFEGVASKMDDTFGQNALV